PHAKSTWYKVGPEPMFGVNPGVLNTINPGGSTPAPNPAILNTINPGKTTPVPNPAILNTIGGGSSFQGSLPKGIQAAAQMALRGETPARGASPFLERGRAFGWSLAPRAPARSRPRHSMLQSAPPRARGRSQPAGAPEDAMTDHHHRCSNCGAATKPHTDGRT